jgi:hypothetical protein
VRRLFGAIEKDIWREDSAQANGVARDEEEVVVQLRFAEANQRIALLAEAFQVDAQIDFLCECGHVDCRKPLSLKLDEYRALRRVPTWFAVTPGHEDPRAERVLESNAHFVLVEKFGDAGLAAVQLSASIRVESGARANGEQRVLVGASAAGDHDPNHLSRKER